jgi:hypothetical protein
MKPSRWPKYAGLMARQQLAYTFSIRNCLVRRARSSLNFDSAGPDNLVLQHLYQPVD